MVSFLLTSLLIELTPGPNMAWLATVALAKGRRPARRRLALGLVVSAPCFLRSTRSV